MTIPHRTLFQHLFWAAVLVAVALAIRLLLILQIPVINGDGIFYVEMARGFLTRSFHEVVSDHAQHPLYSLLMAGVSFVIQDWEWNGRLCSVIFGSLALVPLYALSFGMFRSYTAAVWTGLLYAVGTYFVRANADVQSEGVFHFFLFSGVFFGWRSIAKDDILGTALCGVCAGLAYLARPEGIGILLATGLWISVKMLWHLATCWRITAESWVRMPIRLGLIAMLVIGFFIPASSYLISLRNLTGGWTLTLKKSASSLMRMEPSAHAIPLSEEEAERREAVKSYYAKRPTLEFQRAGKGQRVVLTLLEIGKEVTKASVYPFFLLILLGLMYRPTFHRDSIGEGYLILLVAVYLAVYFLLMFREGYLVTRHVLVIAGLGYVWAGVGLEELCRLIARLQPHTLLWKPHYGADSPAGMKVVFGLLIIVLTLHGNLKVLHADDAVLKEAGEWLRAQPYEHAVIVCNRDEIGFYSDRVYHRIQPATPTGVEDQLSELGADYLALDAGHDFDGFIADEKYYTVHGLRLAHTVERPGADGGPARTVLIFQVNH